MNDITKLQATKDMTDEQKLALAQAMMDASFDDIQDLAKFGQYPKGTYFVEGVQSAEIGLNNDNTQVVVRVIFVTGEAIELAQYPNVAAADLPEGAYPPPGSLYSAQWQGPMGIQRFKQIFEPVIKSIDPLMTPRQLVEMLAAGSVQGITIMNTRRNDKEKVELAADGVTQVPVTYNELVTVMSA